MDCELAQDRANDIEIEYIVLRTLFGELFDRLGDEVSIERVLNRVDLTYPSPRNRKEANAHHHAADRNLTITKFNTIEV